MVTDVVCLSEGYDLYAQFGRAFEKAAPEISLYRPDMVPDPMAVRYAFAHAPAKDAFEPFPNISLICSWGAGVDRLLLHPTLPEGAVISRMTDTGQAEMMAAFAVHYVTGWHRRLFEYPDQQRDRIWREIDWTANANFPVAILGFGNMGRAIGRALQTLGYPVTGWAGRERIVDGVDVLAGAQSLAVLAEQCRALINVLPLTEATTGILNKDLLRRMRGDAVLIQLARGAHLVETDLIPALDAGQPGYAVLDVFASEPLPGSHPFWAHPKIRVTPHVGSSATAEAVARSVANSIAAHKSGRAPDGIVDRARGY